MEPFIRYTGRAVALPRGDVDTDQIVPGEFCKRVTKTGFADALFARWRDDPDFALNRPESQGATILLAGPNFGVGSSREHAVWALRDWGFRAVISPKFGDIFRRNALKNGLLAIVLPQPVVASLMDTVDRASGCEITIDLSERTVDTGRQRWGFSIDDHTRWLLLNGYDDIEATLGHAADIERYERARPSWLPVVPRQRPAAAEPSQ